MFAKRLIRYTLVVKALKRPEQAAKNRPASVDREQSTRKKRLSTQPLFRATGELVNAAGQQPALPFRATLPARTRRVLWLLSASIALMMSGYGIVLPVFAKRLGELGSGVAALGLMSMGFAFSQFLLSPFLG